MLCYVILPSELSAVPRRSAFFWPAEAVALCGLRHAMIKFSKREFCSPQCLLRTLDPARSKVVLTMYRVQSFHCTRDSSNVVS